MDAIKIKFALKAAEEDLIIFVEKFLDAKTFCFMDICYWWDPNVNWWVHKIQAEKLLTLLVTEGCCKRVSCNVYMKSEKFTELLEQIIKIEDILRGH